MNTVKWYVVWISKSDGQIHACRGFSERSADLTASAIMRDGFATSNGKNLNLASHAWAIPAPSKKLAIEIAKSTLPNEVEEGGDKDDTTTAS